MSRTLLVAFSILTTLFAHAQGVGINNPSPDASALLDLTSTDRGLLVPRMTTIQRNAIPVPALSLMIFNTTAARFEFFDGTAWVPFVRDSWSVTGNTGTDPSTHFVGTVDGQPLAFRTNGTERMRVASGPSTSVGINTPNPSSTLHVLFTLPSNINSAVQLETNQSTSATNIGFRNTPNSKFASLGMLSNGDFGLGLDCNFGGCAFGTEVFRVKPNGNFGMGTPNALDRLHVVGNIRMVDGNQAANKVLTSDANGRGTWQVPKQPNHHVVVGTLPTVISTIMTPLPQMSITFTPNHPIAIVHFSGSTPNGTVSCNTMVEFQVVVNGSIVTTFPTGVTGEGGLSTDILGYDAAFTYPIAVTPGVPTTVQINARSTNCSVPSSVNRSLVVIDPNGTGLTTTTGTPPSTGSWDVMGNAGTNNNVNFIGTTDGQPLVVRTNNTERLRVNSNGKVDLGLAGIPFLNLSPLSSGRLQVASVGEINQTLVHASASPSNLSLVFARARGTLNAFTNVADNDALGEMGFYGYRNFMQPGASISSLVDTTTAGSFGGDLRFGTSQPGELLASTKMVITSLGNVGIGTTTPTQRLHVVGRSLFQNGFSADNAALLYRDNLDYMFLGPQSGSSANGGAIALYGSGNTSAGNANGMDVNVPNGKVRFFQTNGQFEFLTNSTNGYTASLELNDVGLEIGHNSISRNIQFVNGGGERMRIDPGGRVGIGTTAPATSLGVNGALSTSPSFALATTNPFNLSPNDRSYVRVGSNNLPASRSVTLAAGLAPGQMLIIECTGTGTNGIQFLDTALQNVGGTKQLLGEDTISFIWNGSKWILTSYADN
jgi:hypothetical protein